MDRRYPLTVSSSEHPLRSTSTVSTSSSTHASALERNFTTSTVATMSTTPTTYSGTSRDKDTIAERPFDRSESFGNKLREHAIGPVPLSDRQPSEPARSVATARSHLATEIKRLKSQEAREDATNSYGDDDYYDEDDDYYSDEESLDSFVNFSLLSNIAVWMRDQVPRGTHVKGSIPYPRAFTGKDIVVCTFFPPLVCAAFDQIYFKPVHPPVTYRLRAPHQPRRPNEQSRDRTASRAQPPAATLFLRSRVGRAYPSGWCRG